MSYNIQILTELFKRIHDNTFDKTIDTDKHRRFKILGGAGTIIQLSNENKTLTMKVPDEEGKTLRIIDEGVDAIEQFVRELQKDKEIKEYVSPNGIEKQIEDVLRRNFGSINDYESFVKTSIVKAIRENINTWEVYIPLVNLKIEKELNLGDVSFVPNNLAANTINDFVSKGDYRFHGNTEEEKEGARRTFLGLLSQITDGYYAFAKVICRSHSSNIEVVATNKAFMAINSIRAFLHVLCPYFMKALWGLPQEITSGLSGIVSLNQGEKHNFGLNYIKNGALTLFVLGLKSIERLHSTCHLETIQNILAKIATTRNSLENAIIYSLQAIGKSIVAPTTDMRFIGYITAIERLLIRDGEEATVEKFTDRLVFVLPTDSSTRLKLVGRAKELYNKRSRMLHAASFFDIFEEDEYDAEHWAINLVTYALKKSKEGYDHKRFCEDIVNRKYQGSNCKE